MFVRCRVLNLSILDPDSIINIITNFLWSKPKVLKIHIALFGTSFNRELKSVLMFTTLNEFTIQLIDLLEKIQIKMNFSQSYFEKLSSLSFYWQAIDNSLEIKIEFQHRNSNKVYKTNRITSMARSGLWIIEQRRRGGEEDWRRRRGGLWDYKNSKRSQPATSGSLGESPSNSPLELS